MSPEPGVAGPVGGQGRSPLVEAISRKAIRPSQFIDETQEESPES